MCRRILNEQASRERLNQHRYFYGDLLYRDLCRGIFSMWVIGAFIPIVVTRDAYYQNLLPGYGQEYADTLMAYMPDWILPMLLVAAFVSGLVGGLIGRKIFKKHFERAGIV